MIDLIIGIIGACFFGMYAIVAILVFFVSLCYEDDKSC